MSYFYCRSCEVRYKREKIGYEDRDIVKCDSCYRKQQEEVNDFIKEGMSLKEIVGLRIKQYRETCDRRGGKD